MAAKKIRVLIADDHRMFAEALGAILATDGRIKVVGQAGDGRSALELAQKHQADVVLMDIAMPVMDGIEATRAIREQLPDTAVVVVTGSAATRDGSRARPPGAAGL